MESKHEIAGNRSYGDISGSDALKSIRRDATLRLDE